MLIGKPSKRPSIAKIRHIKRSLRERLELPEDTVITVTELACLEEDCAPLETVVGLLRPESPALQHRLHKATQAIIEDDLVEICKAWGFDTQGKILAEDFQEKTRNDS